MFEGLRCKRKGHLFVDSRSTPGTVVCVRCRHRQQFDGATVAAAKTSRELDGPNF